MPGSAAPTELTLSVSGRPEQVWRVGPAAVGWVYATRSASVCYRRLRTDTLTLDERHRMAARVGPGPVAVVTPSETWQPSEDPGTFWISYPLPPGALPLLTRLEKVSSGERFKIAASILRSGDELAKQTELGPTLLPAEIVVGKGAVNMLMQPPRAPTVAGVFEEPVRAYFLPPEVVRGSRAGDQRATTAFVLGMIALSCFFRLAPPAPAVALGRAATGSLFDPEVKSSTLPYWLANLSFVKEAFADVARLVSCDPKARSSSDAGMLADSLERAGRFADPLVAADALRYNGRPRDALALLQGALVLGEDCDLLMRAGDLAVAYLDRPLEAVDLFERAIAVDPRRWQAYDAQLRILAGAPRSARLRAALTHDSWAATVADSRVVRDFEHIPSDKASEMERGVASYLVWRGRFDECIRFARSRLEGHGGAARRHSKLTIPLAQALLASGAKDEARATIAQAKRDLVEEGRFGGLGDDQHSQYADDLLRLEIEAARGSAETAQFEAGKD
jgi:tetratricopeptide (TPR) repeat protein